MLCRVVAVGPAPCHRVLDLQSGWTIIATWSIKDSTFQRITITSSKYRAGWHWLMVCFYFGSLTILPNWSANFTRLTPSKSELHSRESLANFKMTQSNVPLGGHSMGLLQSQQKLVADHQHLPARSNLFRTVLMYLCKLHVLKQQHIHYVFGVCRPNLVKPNSSETFRGLPTGTALACTQLIPGNLVQNAQIRWHSIFMNAN